MGLKVGGLVQSTTPSGKVQHCFVSMLSCSTPNFRKDMVIKKKCSLPLEAYTFTQHTGVCDSCLGIVEYHKDMHE